MEGGRLLQSGESLVARFQRYEPTDNRKTVVLEIDANLEERLRRNGSRPDGMREDTFRAFFGDGGELRDAGYQLRELGVDFYPINNDFNDLARFIQVTEAFKDDYIRPLLQERSVAKEGGRVQSSHRREA